MAARDPDPVVGCYRDAVDTEPIEVALRLARCSETAHGVVRLRAHRVERNRQSPGMADTQRDAVGLRVEPSGISKLRQILPDREERSGNRVESSGSSIHERCDSFAITSLRPYHGLLVHRPPASGAGQCYRLYMVRGGTRAEWLKIGTDPVRPLVQHRARVVSGHARTREHRCHLGRSRPPSGRVGRAPRRRSRAGRGPGYLAGRIGPCWHARLPHGLARHAPRGRRRL